MRTELTLGHNLHLIGCSAKREGVSFSKPIIVALGVLALIGMVAACSSGSAGYERCVSGCDKFIGADRAWDACVSSCRAASEVFMNCASECATKFPGADRGYDFCISNCNA